jgi:hypothetical protein
MLYIDATSGGMILQVALSGLVGGVVVLKLFWRNAVNFILRRKPETMLTTDEASDEPQTPVS